MKRLVLFLHLLGLSAMAVLGQDTKIDPTDSIPVINISRLTGSPTSLLPFDREFYLKIPKTKEFELHEVFIHKLKKNPLQISKVKKDDNEEKQFAYRNPKCSFFRVEKRRIELTYGAGNYSVVPNRAVGSSKALSVSLRTTRDESEGLLDAQQITQRKSNVIEKDGYILVKVFPLLVGQYYSFSYTVKSKNDQIGKLIDKTIATYAVPTQSTPAGDPNQLRIIFPEDESLLLAINTKESDKYLGIDEARSMLDTDFDEGIAKYISIAKKLKAGVCVKLSLDIDPKGINASQYKRFQEVKDSLIIYQDSIRTLNAMLNMLTVANSISNPRAFTGFIVANDKFLSNLKKERARLNEEKKTIGSALAASVNSHIEAIETEARNASNIACLIQALVRNGKTNDALSVLFEYDKTLPAAKTKDLQGQAAKVNKLKGLIDAAVTKTESDTVDGFMECYKAFYRLSIECDTCYSSLSVLKSDCLDSCELVIRPSASMHKNDILLGLLPIHYRDLSEKASEKQFAQRKQNLLSTASFIEQVGMVNHLESQKKCSNNHQLLTFIYDRINAINDYEEAKAKLLKDIYGYEINGFALMSAYSAANIMGTSAGSTTLKTKSKFTVRPDFGVAYFSNFRYGGNQRDLHHGFMPFFGVRFNLTPIDPDIAFRRLNYKTFWHRSSISVAYSPISVSNGETRFDAYEKMNFLLGYGFRFSNAINLTVGALMFRQEHKDPFISKKQLAAAPYVALSVDFDIVDVIKDLKQLFIK